VTAVPNIAGIPESPEAPRLVKEVCAQFENTDLGNARRLVQYFGRDLRHVPEWGKWIAWAGSHWKVDVTGEVYRNAKRVAEAILDEARGGVDEKLFHWGLRSQSAGGINAMVSLASTEASIPVLVEELDADPWLLAVANGTLDLRSGALHPADRAHLITKVSPVRWDPDATCPAWDTFLEQILPNPEIRAFMQRCCGYALTGDVSEQVLIVMYGTGSNGKSTFKETVLGMLGEHGKPAPPKLLLARKYDEHPTAIADLHGRRLVVSHEVEDGLRLDEALVKELTGADRLKARFMRQDYWDFAPTHKLWLACNYKPKIRGTDHGIWRRIKLVDFEVTIPDDKQDKQLPAKLRAELPGILRWAVNGCLEWQREGLNPPKAVVDATACYRLESDLLAQFVEERCLHGDEYQVRSTELFADYKSWCAANGLDHPLSQKALAKQLQEKGHDRCENRAGQVIWLGIGLVTPFDRSTEPTL
jgi:putative DNA primase/helicase